MKFVILSGLSKRNLSDVGDIFIINDQREQEWNISRKELLELVKVGILVEEDIEQITKMQFNPVSSSTPERDLDALISCISFNTFSVSWIVQNRCGFEGKGDIWVEDILNLGIS